MHSRRMRTARLLTVSRSAQGWGGSAQPRDADPPGHVTCDACWEATPTPCEQNDTQV